MIEELEHLKSGFCLPQNLTMATVGEVKRSFLETTPAGRARIDAGAVEAIDLVGMQLIIAMLGEETDAGAPRLSALSAPVAQAFQRAGVPLPRPPEPAAQATMATILTVDDSPSVRQMVKLVLSSSGHAVTEACDGSDGLAKASAQKFDLVLTDLNMR